jgi:hypothetical protein
MVTNLERLIEAVEYARDNDQEWYEVFDSLEEANEVISEAEIESPEDYQIATLIAFYDDEDVFDGNLEDILRQHIRKMKKQLRKVMK